MKAIKKVILKDAKVLSSCEMKNLFGGSGIPDVDECSGLVTTISCRNKKDEIIESGTGIGCAKEMISKVCPTGTHHSICVCV